MFVLIFPPNYSNMFLFAWTISPIFLFTLKLGVRICCSCLLFPFLCDCLFTVGVFTDQDTFKQGNIIDRSFADSVILLMSP